MNNFKIIKTTKTTELSTGLDLFRVEINLGDHNEILQIKVNGSIIGEKTKKSKNNYNFFTNEGDKIVLENVIIEDIENISIHLVTLNGKKVVDHDLVIDLDMFVSPSFVNEVNVIQEGSFFEFLFELTNKTFIEMAMSNKIDKEIKERLILLISLKTGVIIDDEYLYKNMRCSIIEYKDGSRESYELMKVLPAGMDFNNLKAERLKKRLKVQIDINYFCIKGYIDEIIDEAIFDDLSEQLYINALLNIKKMIDGKYYT